MVILLINFSNYKLMNTYFRFVFSDLPLSIAFAVPFEVQDGYIQFYKIMWEIIEDFFKTSRSNLISFSRITENDFNKYLIKVDFRIK